MEILLGERAGQRHATFFEDAFDASSWDDISVPGSWQLQGYDRPIYERHLSVVRFGLHQSRRAKNFNPVGHYRDIHPAAAWDGRRIRVHFDGVNPLITSGSTANTSGTAENTFGGHEFDITDKVRTGTNNISVQVFRWCDGSWMEDQDFIRLAGIYRDVYLYATPRRTSRIFRSTRRSPQLYGRYPENRRVGR